MTTSRSRQPSPHESPRQHERPRERGTSSAKGISVSYTAHMASLEPDNSAGLVIGDAVHGQWDSVIEAIAFVVGWLGKYPISCFTQDPLP